MCQIMTVHCPNITRLVLRGCDWVDPASLDYFSSHYNSKKSPQNMEVGVLMLAGDCRTLITMSVSSYRMCS